MMAYNLSQQYKNGKRIDLSEQEVYKLLSGYDDFITWGFIGDPFEKSDLNAFYIVPKRPIMPPKGSQNQEVDYRELTSIATTSRGSWFCCKYEYSYDEFKNSHHYGSFKIQINKENKLILDGIVKDRRVMLLKEMPPQLMTTDLASLITYFEEKPSIYLPLRDISALAFNPDYMNLLEG